MDKNHTNYIKDLREARDWTLRDLEEKTGWSNQIISNLELGKTELTWRKMLKLSEIFDCHPIEIVLGPDNIETAYHSDEKALLSYFRTMPGTEQKRFIKMMEAYAETDDESPAEAADGS